MSAPCATLIRTMALGDPIYTDEQREAIYAAYTTPGITAKRVVERAAAGELTRADGAKLDPFKTTIGSVRSIARRRRLMRSGKAGRLAQMPAQDANEALRQACVASAEVLLQDFNTGRVKDRDPERLRQIVRVVREAAALPAASDPRPPAPGQQRNGQQAGSKTRGGVAGALIKAHRTGQAGPAHERQHNHTEDGEHPRLNGSTPEQQHTQTDARPGSRAAEQPA